MPGETQAGRTGSNVPMRNKKGRRASIGGGVQAGEDFDDVEGVGVGKNIIGGGSRAGARGRGGEGDEHVVRTSKVMRG